MSGCRRFEASAAPAQLFHGCCIDYTPTLLHGAVDTLDLPRHQLPFGLRQVPFFRFDVVVVGGGVAGGAAALAAANAGATVAVVLKGDTKDSNTHWAAGGIAAVLQASDSFDSHVEDTLAVGCGLSDREAVERVVRGGPGAMEWLLALGARFDRAADGSLAVSLEGGHSHARVAHANGDATGMEIQRTLAAALASHPLVEVFPQTFAVDVLTERDGRAGGVLALDARGRRIAFCAAQVVLATGGAGQLYRETTNPDIATGDGVAMALRAGAALRDMEFVQFHPTCLYIAGAARALVSEVVRGHGGQLVDRHGVRFMREYHPDAELAPRDVVSRAVAARMAQTGDTSAYLDLSQVDGDAHELFPGISRICRFFGIDIARDPVPVRPGCHYLVGGVATDLDGRTGVRGLWAVGECASTGLHGANRMGSNSLLEGLVLGLQAGRAAASESSRDVDPRTLVSSGPERSIGVPPGVQFNTQDVVYALKSLMWRQVGVERDGAELADALAKLHFWGQAASRAGDGGARALELVNMLTVARAIVLSALHRRESRGTHHRRDHPSRAEPCHTLLRPAIEQGVLARLYLTHEPVRLATGAPYP
ncbi:MAG: L-aspartate oxidase [Planctomycetota bacterium]|jgi:L-aspartate oxidase